MTKPIAQKQERNVLEHKKGMYDRGGDGKNGAILVVSNYVQYRNARILHIQL